MPACKRPALIAVAVSTAPPKPVTKKPKREKPKFKKTKLKNQLQKISAA
jgi:hypothetical protein